MTALIISAPSGAGKSTIVRHLLGRFPQLAFSVSACSRPKRGQEEHGREYYFFTPEEFREKIRRDELVEWQEVYPGSFYGTLRSELKRIREEGKIPLFDVDVVGGMSLKIYFGNQSLAIFIQPPSLEVLEQRLRLRGTDSEESLLKRIGKAAREMESAKWFDRIVVNDDLERAEMEVEGLVGEWLV